LRHGFLHSNHTSCRQPFIFFHILQGILFSFVSDLFGICCRINDFFKNKVTENEWRDWQMILVVAKEKV